MANTTIGSSFMFQGEITSEDNIVVQGTVKGKMTTSQPVFVENSATLEADVNAESIEISGSVTVTSQPRLRLNSS